MAGATAATAAGITASQASTITINLVGNYISASGGNHLNADLTGDGHPDLTIANAFFASYVFYHSRGPFNYVGASLNGVAAHAFWNQYDQVGTARLGSRYAYAFYPSAGPASVMGSIPVFFKDLHINGGAPTVGSLEVSVSDLFNNSPTIQLDSLAYNTPGPGSRLGLAVPDQGSSLALLAMGAAGILALRRRRGAQERS